MAALMGYAYSKEMAEGGSEHLRMEIYMEGHSGSRIFFMDIDGHLNSYPVENQLVLGEIIIVTTCLVL
jgi:hypothetical protein